MSRIYVESPCEHGFYQRHVLKRTPKESNRVIWSTAGMCEGAARTELRMAALTKAFDDAAAEADVQWNPNLGPILKRASELSEDA